MKIKPLLPAVAPMGIAIFVACGGNVVVDGSSGAASVASSSSASSGGTSFCGMQLDSNAFPCGVSSGPGTTGCETGYCDSLGGGVWTASCEGNTCQCSVQFGSGGEGPVMPTCGCALPAGVDACASGTNCCFTPQ